MKLFCLFGGVRRRKYIKIWNFLEKSCLAEWGGERWDPLWSIIVICLRLPTNLRLVMLSEENLWNKKKRKYRNKISKKIWPHSVGGNSWPSCWDAGQGGKAELPAPDAVAHFLELSQNWTPGAQKCCQRSQNWQFFHGSDTGEHHCYQLRSWNKDHQYQ